MTIKAVIFDLDGTLVDFRIDYKAARAEVVSTLTKQHGIPSSLLSVNEGVFSTLKKVKKHMKKNGKEEEFARVKENVISIIERYESEAASKTNIVPGILETLKTLREMKIRIALFTANSEKTTNYILRRFRLRQFFNVVITRESVLEVKPDPVHLKAVLKALKVKPKEAIVVGDSVRDMECARRLKVLAVGVTTGFSSIEALIRAGADYLTSSSADITVLVKQLNRQG